MRVDAWVGPIMDQGLMVITQAYILTVSPPGLLLVTTLHRLQWQTMLRVLGHRIVAKLVRPNYHRLRFPEGFMKDSSVSFVPIIMFKKRAVSFISHPVQGPTVKPKRHVPSPSIGPPNLFLRRRFRTMEASLPRSSPIFPPLGEKGGQAIVLVFRRVVRPFMVTFDQRVRFFVVPG